MTDSMTTVLRVARPTHLLGAFAAVTVLTGLVVIALGGDLGTATPPFLSVWAPRVNVLAVVSVLALATAVLAGPRLLSAPHSGAAFATAVFGAALGLGVAVNLARHGVNDLDAVFVRPPQGSFEASNEYLPGLRAFKYGTGFTLDRFAELVSSEPVNVAGHPPGLILTLHALGIDSGAGLAALCIGVGALTAPLTYALGRELRDERTGRLAALLFALSPSVLLFGTTSADFLYAALGTAAAALLVHRGRKRRLAGAAALAVAAFFSWALLAVGAWSAVVVWRREGAGAAARLAFACAIAVLAANGALALATGYDPIGALSATSGVYRAGIASTRPYAFWLFGAPVAWALAMGVPIAARAVRALARREPEAIALAVVIAVAAVLGFTKGETERIWLFFVPLACVSAAALPSRRVRLLLGALAAQALVVELLFDNIW